MVRICTVILQNRRYIFSRNEQVNAKHDNEFHFYIYFPFIWAVCVRGYGMCCIFFPFIFTSTICNISNALFNLESSFDKLDKFHTDRCSWFTFWPSSTPIWKTNPFPYIIEDGLRRMWSIKIAADKKKLHPGPANVSFCMCCSK